jgi:hypothetical protein
VWVLPGEPHALDLIWPTVLPIELVNRTNFPIPHVVVKDKFGNIASPVQKTDAWSFSFAIPQFVVGGICLFF